jgi:hypothetical protein
MREESDRRKRNIMLFSVNTTKSTEASLGPNGIGAGVIVIISKYPIISWPTHQRFAALEA